MDALRRFVAIVTADLLERSRSMRFWVMLGLIALASWWFFPARDAYYLTVAINGAHRGVYSSAWIGMVLALIFSTLLSLVGFYLVRGTLTRDIDTRVWQLLVATPMTRPTYMFAKWCSHLLVLLMLVGVGVVVGGIAQIVRAEDSQFNLIELLKPLLILSLPSLAVTSMFAIWFDLVPWLRRTLGNVLYFFIWIGLLSLSMTQVLPQHKPSAMDAWLSDPGGVIVFVRAVERLERPELGGTKLGNINVIRPNPKREISTFEWKEWQVQAADLRTPLIWLVIAAAGVWLSSRLLEWGAAQASRPAGNAKGGNGYQLRWLSFLLRPLQKSAGGALLAVELQLVLRQRSWWWWLLMVIASGVQLFAPPEISAVAIIIAWMLLLDVFGTAILRERTTRTAAFVFSAAGAAKRVLITRWLMVVLLAWLVTLPAFLKLLGSNPAAALTLLVTGASLATWGLALGAVSRTSRAFELLTVLLAYFSLNGLPALHVISAPAQTLLWHAVALPIAGMLLLLMWPKLNRD